MAIFAAMFHHFHDEKKHIKGQGSLTADTFRQLLLTLQQQYNILPPLAYAERIRQNALAEDEICLTFDDALKCQVDIALPVLQELNLQAFFFVYSGALYGPPDHLEIFRDFRHREFTSVDSFYAAFFANFATNQPAEFTAYQQSYPVDYLKEFPFYTEMDRRFRYVRDNVLGSEPYEATIFAMMDDCNYSIEEHAPKLFMTESDLQHLCATGNTIGLHSSSHPTTLDKYSRNEQWEEYSNNKAFLEQCIGDEIWAMSHPCGRYTADTLKLLRDLGIDIGFRSSLSVPQIHSSLEIPREDHANLVKTLL
ncbi:MAG: polysaccharide deacetylase family protein [Geoalkalibacter sp.]|uniref:polysaccharide deacetylase family protein n=1 Tax=Geoalkalibacter sp. TaxID=3041440 RepID=UPI003D0AA85C